MNQKVIEQLVSQPPKVVHNNNMTVRKLELLYGAILNIDPHYGDLEIPDNASVSYVYSILNNYLLEKGISLNVDDFKNVNADYTYLSPFDSEPFMFDLNYLVPMRKNKRSEYLIILFCIIILSKVRFNALDHYEWWEENAQENIEMAKDEKDEEGIAYYSELLEQLTNIYFVDKDYCRFYDKDVAGLLAKFRANQRETRKIDSFIITIVDRTLEVQRRYEQFKNVKANELFFPDNDGCNDRRVHISYYCGFGMYDDSDDIIGYINDDYEMAWQSGEVFHELQLTPENITELPNIEFTINEHDSIIYTLSENIKRIADETC